MSPMDSKTIQIGGMAGDWDDFRVELWLETGMMMGTPGMTGMPGMDMMSMATYLAIYGPSGMGSDMGMGMGMGGVLGRESFASNLAMGAVIGVESFFDVWTELYGSGEFREEGGYIGLQTGMGQYGWLHMLSQSNIGTDAHTVTFDGWAYEDRPGVPIAAGQGETCDWIRRRPHKMHWAQPPDEGFTGVDVSLGQCMLADDFKCTATGPIRDIHIWGSFLDDMLPKAGPDSLTFELSIYSDVPGTEREPSRPGRQLWTKTFRAGEYNARKIHDGPEDWYDPVTGLYLAGNHRSTFQYNFCIDDRDAFAQEEGEVYWLTVKDVTGGTGYTFGWKTTAQQFRWNDDAAYLEDQTTGWVEMAYPKGHKYVEETLDLAFVITDGEQTVPERDLGDAPDSSNSVAETTMTAYPGVTAHFPTVCQAGSPPYGPVHLFPRDMYYLGRWVSSEIEADIGLDEDVVNNLDPVNDVANRDGADDGLRLPVYMPFCGSTTLEYTVTVTNAAARDAYVNVWCDWNRDGDWDDVMTCTDGSRVSEWAVQNDKPVFAGVGTYTFTTSSFKCWHPGKEGTEPIWVRITIGEQMHLPSVVIEGAPSGIEGAGPAGGYQYGETEDYYIRPMAQPPAAKYDWGDAPEGAAAPGYPTLLASNGARHVIAGPWLGDANDVPDAETDGQPDLNALGDDGNGTDDENGVSIAPLIRGQPADATIEVNGGGGVVQAWIDFNADRTWQAGEKIFDAFLPDGVHVLSFSVPNSAALGQTFARFRISRQGGLSPVGEARDGEVEDLQVWIDPPADPKKWCQLPDTTPHGIDIRVDKSDDRQWIVADDFQCTSVGTLKHVRLWGSWKDDRKGEIKKLRLRVYPDDPVGPGGADKKNLYSKPGPEILWEKEFLTGQFTETLYHVVHIAGEWWWDPVANEALPGGDTEIWRIDVAVDPAGAFVQQGTPDTPRIYWLAVETETADGEFGWKTRRWPDHFMDDAVWAVEPQTPLAWREMFYPHGHEHYDVERNSIDMAFCLLFEGDGTQVTSQAVAVTECPPTETTCPALLTECPVVETRCPSGQTYCPVVQTSCPPAPTKCPATATECQTVDTQCPVVETRCPVMQTECPTAVTRCPAMDTRCPAEQTKCPPTATECQLVRTQCPVVETECPATPTECPPAETQCPTVETKCPPAATECPVLLTECPPAETRCPVESTKCPMSETQCPVEYTKCPPTATECQTVLTECPPAETRCPIERTKCPALQTNCPPEDTKCPVSETQCPVVYTKCPESETKCPESETKCPVVTTACPVVETECPALRTECPPLATECSGVLTQCPTPGTPCGLSTPLGGQRSERLTRSDCPIVEADCLTVSKYLVALGTR
jgi:hypothetical protein